jgi:hypothetical protein
MHAPRVPAPVVLVTAGPVCVALIILVAFMAGETVGYSPLRYRPPHSVAEAAALATASEVLRHLRAGADPSAIVTVRPDVISSDVTKVSAVEAAVWGRTIELIRLLDREGAIPTPERRQYLACLSEALDARDILAYLAPHGISGCDAAGIMHSIQSRGR